MEGVVGSSFTGDIALDDLKTVAGDCQPNGFCDFERIFCSWNNVRIGGSLLNFLYILNFLAPSQIKS